MSTDQNDITPEADDVEGHGFHNRTVAPTEDDDVEGHGFHNRTVAPTEDDDDVEGHGLSSHTHL